MKLTDTEILAYKQRQNNDSVLNRGFMNLTRDRRVAIYQAWSDTNHVGKPVLFEIVLYKAKPGWFLMDSPSVTAFRDENEVVVRDGWPFFIKKLANITEMGQTMIIITLHLEWYALKIIFWFEII